MSDRLYTNEEMARDFGSYPRKIKAAIAIEGVRTIQVGKRQCVDQEGYEQVRDFLARYQRRPILRRATAASA